MVTESMLKITAPLTRWPQRENKCGTTFLRLLRIELLGIQISNSSFTTLVVLNDSNKVLLYM